MLFCLVAALFHIWSTSCNLFFDIKRQGKLVLYSGEKMSLDFLVELTVVSSTDISSGQGERGRLMA